VTQRLIPIAQPGAPQRSDTPTEAMATCDDQERCEQRRRPIINRTAPSTAAVSDNAAASTLGSTDANANFSY
jgi:hypothetical protein